MPLRHGTHVRRPLRYTIRVTFDDIDKIARKLDGVTVGAKWPWEKNMIPIIDKAIRASDLGINPVSDSEQVRLPIPPLTQERRRDLAKSVGKQSEEARVAVRAARRDAMDLVKDAEKEKSITEDDRKNGEKRVQDLTDKYVASVDEIAKAKEKEIMDL